MIFPYLDALEITDVKEVEVKPWQMTPSGYGCKLLTRHMVKLKDGHWRRVYAICFSNTSTAFVLIKRAKFIIGPDAEERIEKGLISSQTSPS